MKRAAIYIRVSSDEQVHETYGLPEQLAKCKEYANRMGYTLAGDKWADLNSGIEIIQNGNGWFFADPYKAEKANAKSEEIEPIRCYVDDYTGKRVRRPGMDALRDYVEREGLDAVIPRDTQRFARHRHAATYLKDWFKKRNVEIDYATQDFADNSAGRAQEGMHEIFDEWQADELREKAIRGRRRSAKMGNVVLSQPPYGYRLDGDSKNRSLLIDEESADVVRMIFDLYVNGEEPGTRMSLTAVAKRLTALRIPTSFDKLGRRKKSGYGVWSPSSVRTIIRNSTYIGQWCYGKRKRVAERVKRTPDGRQFVVEVESSDAVPQEQWIKVEVPPILEGDEGTAIFQAAQERLRENKRLTKRNNSKYQYLLRGMLLCECGSPMTGTPAPQGDYAYYRCTRHQWEKSNGGQNRCPSKMLRADKADKETWGAISNRLLDCERLIDAMRDTQAGIESELQPLKEQLQWVEERILESDNRIDQAMRLYMSDDDSRYPKEWLDEKIDMAKKEKQSLVETQQELLRRIEAARISDHDIETVETFARRMKKSLQNTDFETKRRVFEILRVQGRVEIRDGDQIIVGSWIVPDDEVIVNVTNPTWWTLAHLWILGSNRTA